MYVLYLPKAHKDSIWTKTVFGLYPDLMKRISHRFALSPIQEDISVALLKHYAVCLLGLTGLEKAQRQTCACARICTLTHTGPFLLAQEGMMTLIIASK